MWGSTLRCFKESRAMHAIGTIKRGDFGPRSGWVALASLAALASPAAAPAAAASSPVPQPA
jgi:hypothetical protein